MRLAARRDAVNHLDIEPGNHTYTTIAIEKLCHIAQDRVWAWLAKANEPLFAQLEDLSNRIAFINGRIANLKSVKTETARASASNYAKIQQAHGDLLEKLALKAQVEEAIIANNEIAESAIETWEIHFEKQAAIYLEALHKRARRLLKTPKSQPIKTAQIPMFQGLPLRVRDGFSKKTVIKNQSKA